MATEKQKRMKVSFPDGSSHLHLVPNIPVLEKVNEHMLELSRRGVIFPKATLFEIVEVDIDSETGEPIVVPVTQEGLKATQ